MLKGKGGKAKGFKSHAEGPKPRVPHLGLLLELGTEDRRAIPPRLEVISCVGELVELIQMNDIIPRESQAHLLVESIYATQDPKQVRGALMESQPMIDQIVSGHPTHGKCHSSFYESDYKNDNLPFFSICNYSIWSIIP